VLLTSRQAVILAFDGRDCRRRDRSASRRRRSRSRRLIHLRWLAHRASSQFTASLFRRSVIRTGGPPVLDTDQLVTAGKHYYAGCPIALGQSQRVRNAGDSNTDHRGGLRQAAQDAPRPKSAVSTTARALDSERDLRPLKLRRLVSNVGGHGDIERVATYTLTRYKGSEPFSHPRRKLH